MTNCKETRTLCHLSRSICPTRPGKNAAVLPLRADGGVDLPVREKRLNPVGFEVSAIRLFRSTLALLVREFVTGFDVQLVVNQQTPFRLVRPLDHFFNLKCRNLVLVLPQHLLDSSPGTQARVGQGSVVTR